MTWLRIFLLALALLLSVQSATLWAASAPKISGGVVRDFARLKLEWPQKVKFSASGSGSKITLHFGEAAAVDTTKIVAGMQPYVTKAVTGSDGKSVTLTLNKAYKFRTFISGNATGIDLLGVNPADAKAKPEKNDALEKQGAKKIDLGKREPKAEEKKKDAPKPTAQKIEAKTAEKKIEVKPAEKNIPKPAPDAAPAKAEIEKPKTDEAPKADMALPSLAETPEPTVKPGELAISLTRDAEGGVTLNFPFAERAGAAVFIRAGHLWAVFDKPAKADLSAMKDGLPLIENGEQIAHANYAILRFAVRGQQGAIVTASENGLNWKVKLSGPATPARLPVALETAGEAGKIVLIAKAAEAGEPLTFEDPDIGDELIVTPFYASGQGVYPARSFVDFTLPATAQGLVVAKKNDEVRESLTKDGARIFSVRGLNLTANLPVLSAPASANVSAPVLAEGETLFPYEQWKFEPKNRFDFDKKRLELTEAILKAPPDRSNAARIRLAMFYLGQDMPQEALSVLDTIKQLAPDFYTAQKAAAYRGAANFLLYHIAEAGDDFAAPELANLPEITLWKEMLGEMLGAGTPPFDLMKYHDAYIKHYPPALRQQLSVIGADLALGRGDYATALAIFEGLKQSGLIEPIQKYADYITASTYAKTGQAPAAIELWQKLAGDNDRFMRARAEYSLVAFLLENSRISVDDAIKRLERLRVVWRGDTLEINVLNLLGQLYYSKKDYVSALRTMREVVTDFPNTQDALATAQKMAEIFVALFNQGEADKLPPLEALAVYYEFRELTPLGSEGDIMIRNLADRLAAIDLLDRASALLDHQIRYRLEKEERSRVGARLALLYLLNREPDNALRALELSNYGANPEPLQRMRDLLAARSMMETGQYAVAKATIAKDKNPEAEELRLDIFWKAKDWRGFIAAAEDTLGNRQDIAAQLTDPEIDMVLKLALAYTFENDGVQLQYLRDYFGPLIADASPKKEMFLFITGATMGLDPKNFEQVSKDISNVESFLGNFRDRMKKEKLSDVVK